MTSTPTAPDPAPDPDQPLTFRVRCVDDLIALAPIVVGFHPADDVVMMASDGERPFHARVDLPPAGVSREDVALLADLLLAPVGRHGIRGLAFVFFSDDDRAVRRVWSALRRRAERAGIHVQDAVRVDGARYYPLLGDARRRETGVAYDVSTHPFFAHAVLHGLVVEKDRASLAAGVRPDPGHQADVARALAAAGLTDLDPPRTGVDRRRWGDWLRGLVLRHVGARSRPTADEVARIAWAVQDLRVRDAAWGLIERAGARAHQEFWLDVARRVPEPMTAAPVALLGWAAWRAGNGALAWIAVDRCREVAPGYGMATILAGMLEQAVAPDTLDDALAWDEGLPA